VHGIGQIHPVIGAFLHLSFILHAITLFIVVINDQLIMLAISSGGVFSVY